MSDLSKYILKLAQSDGYFNLIPVDGYVELQVGASGGNTSKAIQTEPTQDTQLSAALRQAVNELLNRGCIRPSSVDDQGFGSYELVA